MNYSMHFRQSGTILLAFPLIPLTYSFAITAGPEPTYVAEILNRDIIDTWGYVSGSSASPVTCPSGYTRTYDGVAANFLACCNEITCVNDWHLCVPYGGTACPYPSICSEVYTSYTSCPQTLPGCMTYFLPTVAGQEATEGITSYDCGAQNTLIRLVTSVTGVAAQATATSDNTNTGDSSPSTANPTSGPSTSMTTTSPVGGSGLSTTNIVVIVIVGSFVIAVVIWIVWFFTKPWRCCSRRRKEDYPDTTSTAVADPNFEAVRRWALNNRGEHEMT